MKNKIFYSQCWEDSKILEEALNISKKDKILSISSAGDNSLFLLSKNPEKVVSIDINPLQNFLLELKAQGIKELKYKDFLELIGVLESSKRICLYDKIKSNLSNNCKNYWNNNSDLIKKGVIHCGKFERYIKIFRRILLPLSQSKSKINQLFKLNNLKQQEKFYNNKWDNPLWIITFKVFFSKFLLKILGRNKNFFKYNKTNQITEYYLTKIKRNLTNIPIKTNYFLYYILKGEYNKNYFPDYLKQETFNKIKKNISKLEIVTLDLKNYLKQCKKNSFSKFNMSDVFEIFSQTDYEELIREIVRVSKKKGEVCYWNHLVKRTKHPQLNKFIKKGEEKSQRLFGKDRVFFYNNFILESINKI